MSSVKVPLLNHYKKEFVLRRFPQTFLGGINLRLGYDAPFYVKLSQLLLWIVPMLIGGIFTLAISIGGMNIVAGSIIAGCIYGFFILFLQLAHYISTWRNDKTSMDESVVSSSLNLKQLLAQEDEIIFDSFCSTETFNFVVPPKRLLANVFLHSMLSGILCGFGVWYSLPEVYTALYGSNVAATVVLFIFSWLAICIASFPLAAGGVPPEVCTFHFVDQFEFASLTRPLHIFIFYSFHIVQVFDSSFQTVNQVLHILFVFLPLLWVSGILPPIDSMLSWIVEQLLIFALGGSPVASDLRLFVSFVLSGAIFTGACFLSTIQALILYSAAFGFVLSTDTTSLLIDLVKRAIALCKKSTPVTDVAYESTRDRKEPFVSILAFGWHAGVFLLNIVLAALAVNYRALFTAQAKLGLQIVFISLYAFARLLADAQKVYVFFRLFRNLLYPPSYSRHINFNKRKNVLNIFGYVYFGVISVVAPMLMVCYLSAFLLPDTSTTLPSVLLALGATHAFRTTWQRSEGALANLVIVSVLDLISANTSASLGWFDSLGLGPSLLLVDVALDRLVRLLDNLWFALALLVTSWTDKKQRRGRSSVLLLALNVVFFPVVILAAATSSALAAPLLPLFTLPLFYVAFPRPSRFWPLSPGSASANVCADTALYRQMSQDVTHELSRGLYRGGLVTLGRTGSDVSLYLARSQDKTFWVQQLESGYGYASYSVKGLELQETSCHALEATRLDDQCEAAFEMQDQQTCRPKLNPYPMFSVVTQLDTVFVQGYSDAKTSLSGVIDQPQAQRQLQKDFVKCMVWMLVHHECANRQSRNLLPIIAPTPPSDDRRSASNAQGGAEVHGLKLQEADSSRPRSRKRSGKRNIVRKKSEPSLGSLASILASDEDVEKKRSSSGKRSLQSAVKIPGYVSDEDEEDWEMESAFSDSGFGLPAVDVEDKKKQRASGKPSSARKSASATQRLDFHDIPMAERDLRPFHELFDSSWHCHVTAVVEQDTGEVMSSGAEDDRLLHECRKVVLACHLIVNVQGVPGRDPTRLGPGHVVKVFSGDIPWSPDLEWLQKHPKLHKMVLKAYRYAVKFMYDRAAMGLSDDVEDDIDDVTGSLREYDTDWMIDLETSRDWTDAAEQGKVSLFTISFDADKNEYSARTLIRRPVEVHVAALSPTAVRAFWANQAAELLYATNDDEERYSIQAHQSLLRNLTTQAADSPLGYPVYSSTPILERTLPLTSIKADWWLWRPTD